MKLSQLLTAIEQIAENKGLSKPYIVGGLVRDKLLNRIDQISDIDITTGDSGIHFLAAEIAEQLKDHTNFSFERMTDGHSKLTLDGFSIDFSSNFKTPGIKYLLEATGIDNPSEMQKELYSRDFTCNAALMTMDLKNITDPTGLAVEDIKAKIIKTCLPPKITLGYDNNRIVRVIYVAAKLGFDVDDSIKEWIADHPELITNSRPDYIGKKLKKAAEFDSEKTASLLSELGLWKFVPFIPELIEYQKRDLISTAGKKKPKKRKKRVDLDVRPYPNPLFRNYDYGGQSEGSETSPGTGLYHGPMSQHKSVKEFLDKARKREYRKAQFEKIISDLDIK